MSDEPKEIVFAYHEGTKHHFHRYAPGPGGLDWANQPDPFRRYHGAPLLPLVIPASGGPSVAGPLPATFNQESVSDFFYHSLALSAWKQAGGSRWALRVNPSSGNLHPTEGYLISDALPGLCDQAAVYHYAPREHGLELRAKLSPDLWRGWAGNDRGPRLWVGLASVPWREAWKYGERAFRYCHHDVGHALAAIRIAADLLGWQAVLLDDLAGSDLTHLLGLHHQPGIEPEHPDCLIEISPKPGRHSIAITSAIQANDLAFRSWIGQPNRLSREVIEWPMIAAALSASQKPRTPPRESGPRAVVTRRDPAPIRSRYERKWIRQRRSAVSMDGVTVMSLVSFCDVLQATLPGQVPFDLLPWPARVHLVLFVHRVEDLAPGLYCLLRHPACREEFQAECHPDFEWAKPPGCPVEMPLYRLKEADVRQASALVSCYQDIAADGCFSLGMLAEFAAPIQQLGAWIYPRLFWECGLIGQVLYLQAERAGLRATGIGCFFDDAMHQLLGLKSARYQSLYHFTVGGPVEDPRITTLPACSPPGNPQVQG